MNFTIIPRNSSITTPNDPGNPWYESGIAGFIGVVLFLVCICGVPCNNFTNVKRDPITV